MNKNEAHSILDRIKTDREPMSIFITNEALRLTGDISRISYPTLRFDGSQSQDDRAIKAESKGTKEGFSYSAYLDSTENKGDAT